VYADSGNTHTAWGLPWWSLSSRESHVNNQREQRHNYYFSPLHSTHKLQHFYKTFIGHLKIVRKFWIEFTTIIDALETEHFGEVCLIVQAAHVAVNYFQITDSIFWIRALSHADFIPDEVVAAAVVGRLLFNPAPEVFMFRNHKSAVAYWHIPGVHHKEKNRGRK
jgi:hypothetical protein